MRASKIGAIAADEPVAGNCFAVSLTTMHEGSENDSSVASLGACYAPDFKVAGFRSNSFFRIVACLQFFNLTKNYFVFRKVCID